MDKHKLIVVVGAAGKLGRLIIGSLLEQPDVRVRALVRDPQKPEVASLAGPRVELVAFDASATDDAARTRALSGAFAVVSALQGGPDIIVDAQLALIRAAREVGARRFLPSAYSYNFFALPAGINVNSDWRRTLGVLARKETTERFEVVHVLQGIFTDSYVLGFLGLVDPQNGVVRYWGDGKTPIDWTSWEDTARFVAAAATDERAVPERLYVAGERMDIHAFADAWAEHRGAAVAREALGTLSELDAETQRRLAAEPQNMYAWLPLMYARAVFGGQALLETTQNARYPHIEAETVAKSMARGAV